jgi:hypothetical protein
MPRSCGVCTHKERGEIERDAEIGKAAEMAHAGKLVEELRALIVDTHRMKRNAERKGDTRTALVAVRELCRLTELRAKLSGELNERAQHNELHLHLPEDRALRVAETYIARHGVPKLPAELPAQVIDVAELEETI